MPASLGRAASEDLLMETQPHELDRMALRQFEFLLCNHGWRVEWQARQGGCNATIRGPDEARPRGPQVGIHKQRGHR